MNPLLSLTTDFGTIDGYVGAMKGRILSICPNATVVDITHDIAPQNIVQASWTLLRSTLQFPKNSIHVVVVDPGVGSDRRAILLKSEERWFIGPDNGVFSEIIRKHGSQEIYEIKKQTKWWRSHDSFDGLALFAPTAAHLASGLAVKEIGDPISRMLQLFPASSPVVKNNQIQGQVQFFDRFGNAVTNIGASHLQTLANSHPTISCRSVNFKLVQHYLQGKNRGAVALINSDDMLELSAFGDSAQIRFSLNAGDDVLVES